MCYTVRHGEDKAHTVRRGGLRADQEEERLVRGPHREDTRPGGNALAARCTSGTVTLHRLVLVFHGGGCVLAEEV